MVKPLTLPVTVIILICVLIGNSRETFAGTLTLYCEFPKYATADGIEKAKDFSLKYIVDTTTDKAVLVGNNGLSDVIMIPGEFGITFIELLQTGAAQSTTILTETLSAVHSRHSMTRRDTLLPSQYYGNCIEQ